MNRESAAKKIQEAYRKKYSIRTNENFMRHAPNFYKYNYNRPKPPINRKNKLYKKVYKYSNKTYRVDPAVILKKLTTKKYSGNVNTIKKLQKAYRNKYYIKSNSEYARKIQQYRNYLKQFGENGYNNNNLNNNHKLLNHKLHIYRYNHPKKTTTYPSIWNLERNIRTHAAKTIQAAVPKFRERLRRERLNAFKETMEPRTFNAGKAGKMSIPNDVIRMILNKA